MADVRVTNMEETPADAYKNLIFFSLLMLSLPVTLYFVSKAYIFEGMLKMTNPNSYFYAAIVAVVTVHIVLAMFIYVAFKEGKKSYKKAD